MSNGTDVIDVPAHELTKGMRVYRRDRFGNLKVDFRIGERFTTSGPARLQPIAFYTDNGVKVFAQCAIVEVGTGRKAQNTAEGSRVIGKHQRRNGKARRKDRKVGVR